MRKLIGQHSIQILVYTAEQVRSGLKCLNVSSDAAERTTNIQREDTTRDSNMLRCMFLLQLVFCNQLGRNKIS